jgi:FkbH-like protein
MESLKYTEILQQNKLLKGTIDTKPYNIGILSNVTVNAFQDVLEYNCRLHQIEPDISIGNFDNIVQDSAQSADKDMVIIFYDLLGIIDNTGIYFEGITEQAFQALLLKLKSEIDLILHNLKNAASVIFNFFSAAYFPPQYSNTSRAELLAKELNNYLEANRHINTHLIDINKVIMQMGIANCIDFRFYNSSKAPYTITFLKEYTLAIQPVILKNNGKLKKALIFDCDNTLWKGIVGEDGMDGIDFSASSNYGKRFHAVQQQAVFLSSKGVLIGLCSKNNEADVEEILLRKDMVLRNENIVIKKVNWTDKATNLRSIAAELNIGLDSLVFVDDSDFEINLIREQLPEILTLQVPKQLSDYPDQLQKLINRYFSLSQSKEDAQKTEMYKQQSARAEAQDSFQSIEDYLASLEICLTIVKDEQEQIPRIAQLTQKTNQFNLTTKRYTEQQISDFMNRQGDVIFSIFVRDKFGDSGLTGVCILRTDEADKNIAVIDSLLMSCRIIGRNIEYAFMNQVMAYLVGQGFSKVKASFAATKKNAQVADFYDHTGFRLVSADTGDKHYEAVPGDYQPKPYTYIQIEQR